MNMGLKVRITDTEGTVEGDKRQYVPAVLRWTCPTCGRENDRSYYGDYYLSYPSLGGFKKETLYCDACDDAGREPCEFEVTLKTTLTMQVVNVEESTKEGSEILVDDTESCPFIREAVTSPSYLCNVENLPDRSGFTGDCVGLDHEDCPVRQGLTIRARGES